MTPFRMIVTLGSPVVVSEFAPQFDALIFEALQQKHCNHTEQECIDKMKEILLFNDEIGVFHASSMRFVVTPDRGVIAKEYVRTDYIKNKLSSEMFLPTSKKGYVKVMTAGGPYKTRMSTRLSYCAKYCVFDAVGDKDAISSLLKNTHFGIGYDALNCGCGEVIDLDFIELDLDISLEFKGAARRNLPETNCSLKGVKSSSRIIPPYYSAELLQPVISPERIEAISHTQILLSK